MDENIIFSNDFLKIFSSPDGVFIETFKKGFSFDQLNSIIISHPQLEITAFHVLKTALSNAPHEAEKFGVLKDRIVIEIEKNDLKAYVTFNLTKDELDIKNREHLIRETSAKLTEKGIVYGINKSLFVEDLLTGKPYVIAEGTPPVNGKDSIIKMYELQEAKPEIHQDGKVDFYELKLINRVQAGEWLGERLDPTEGTPGKSIKDVVIKPVNGKTIPLNYDKNTVMEIYENQKTTLYSRSAGAVSFADGKISVSNHLEIAGDVDFKTGNIKFDGYLSIKGTVTDGFFVQATKDIEINSPLGLGNVKGIISTGGSVFIKGGIASKGRVEIKAAKNIYTKFVDNSVLSCGGTAHIGFYSINSDITAGEVVVESSNGQIIGGNINARIRVLSPTVGSEMEKRTVIVLAGFDREAYKKHLDEIINNMIELKNEQQKLKILLSQLDGHGELSAIQRKEYNDAFQRMHSIKDEARELEEKRKEISNYLKTRGDGEINITKKIYPNCSLHLKKNIIEISTVTMSTVYYIQDNEVKQAN